MHSEPSKAAMERAKELIGGGLTFSAFARYIDTVDRVAREVDAELKKAVDNGCLRSDYAYVVKDLHALRLSIQQLMLPDEPEAPLDVIMRKKGVGQQVRSEVLTALAAAGYTITKEPTV